jgi:hypothetical protein
MPLPGEAATTRNADSLLVGGTPPIRLLLPLAVLFGALAAVPQAIACGTGGYTYAGLASAGRSHGVGARVTAIGAPVVRGDGHVAGWVGVGGPRQGPHGADEWIQVGFSGFPGSYLSSLYFEVMRPGSGARYVEVERGLAPGASRRLAVLEMAGRPNWWRVWVNDRPVSRPILLPGSHGTWRAIATAESWRAGGSGCNGFGYRFERIVVAQSAGGGWRPLADSLPILSGGYRVLRPTGSSLVAISGKLLRANALRPVLSASKPVATTPSAPALTATAQAEPAPPVAGAVATEDPTAELAPAEAGGPLDP